MAEWWADYGLSAGVGSEGSGLAKAHRLVDTVRGCGNVAAAFRRRHDLDWFEREAQPCGSYTNTPHDPGCSMSWLALARALSARRYRRRHTLGSRDRCHCSPGRMLIA